MLGVTAPPVFALRNRVSRTSLALGAAVFVVGTATASAAGTTKPSPELRAWALTGNPPVGISAQGFHGPLVRQLSPGLYHIDVQAVRDMPFHLFGPGVDRKTIFSLATGGTFTIYARWTVRFRPGRYRYEAWGIYGQALRERGLKANGSFVVR